MKILIGGDICPMGRNEALFRKPQAMLENPAKILSGYDLVIANLECPLIEAQTPIVKGGPVLGVSKETIAGLKALGIHVVTLANNHIMDHGDAGLKSTLFHLAQAGIKHVGANMDLKSASETLMINQNQEIAILAFAEKEYSYATPASPGACPLDVNLIVRKLLSISKHAFKIVLLHAGNEMFPYPNPWLQDTCHLLVELGANLVICQHSHCIGAYERYQNAMIVYGQGNLVFDRYSKHHQWWKSVLISVEVTHNLFAEYQFLPVIQNPGTQVFRLADDNERQQILSELDGYSNVVINPHSLAQEWEKFCRDKKKIYQSLLFGHDQFAYYLNRLTGFSDLKTKAGKMNTGNVLRCASHLEVLRTIYSLKNTTSGNENL